MTGLKGLVIKLKTILYSFLFFLSLIILVFGCTIKPSGVIVVDASNKETEIACNKEINKLLEEYNNKLKEYTELKPVPLTTTAVCKPLPPIKLPINAKIPLLPSFSEEEQEDRVIVEDKLIKHIKELRAYIKKLISDLEVFESRYNEKINK